MEFWRAMFKRKEKLGFAPKEAAHLIGVSEQLIGQWEDRKNTKRPSFDTMIRIASAYECSTDYILGLTDNPRPIANDALSSEAREVMECMSQMSDRGRAEILTICKSLLEFDRGWQNYELAGRFTSTLVGDDRMAYYRSRLTSLASELGFDVALDQITLEILAEFKRGQKIEDFN